MRSRVIPVLLFFLQGPDSQYFRIRNISYYEEVDIYVENEEDWKGIFSIYRINRWSWIIYLQSIQTLESSGRFVHSFLFRVTNTSYYEK